VILNDQWLFVFGGFDGMKRNDLHRARVEVPSDGQIQAAQANIGQNNNVGIVMNGQHPAAAILGEQVNGHNHQA